MIEIGDESLQQELDVLTKSASIARDEEPQVDTQLIPPEPVQTDDKMSINADATKRREPEPSPVDSSVADEIMQAIKKQKEDEDDANNCVICLSCKKNVLLLPCKHLCICTSCSPKATDCPLCRTKIENRTTVFL